jgi:asparagine synthase (glutamine-hydrolysing)
MCGIAGYWDDRGLPNQALQVLQRMTSAIAHRGPDDAGEACDESSGLAIGHRRLSIIDLSPTGHQPMVSSSSRYRIVYNGEIYNFRELRAELQGAGASFRGTSDTEVLLEAFEHWGLLPTLKRIAGMFAFALWDNETRSLHLVRDRVGEKPLYYGFMDGVLLFGSELKALRQHPSWDASIDRGALALYLRFSYVPAPHTIYAGVRKVRPGTMVTFRGGREPEEQQYWSAMQVAERGMLDPLELSEAALIDACEERLSQTISEQMISDVPLGAFLSGGIDSSLVTALMQAQSAGRVKTFTIGFPIAAYNEATHARAVAAHLGTAHTELIVSPAEALDVIPSLPAMYDEPFADSSQIPTYLVARMARAHVTVSLSGDGGDEVFGGYNRYLWGNRLRRGAQLIPRGVRGAIADGIRAVSPARWDSIFGSFGSVFTRGVTIPGDRLHKLAGLLTADTADELYGRLTAQWMNPAEVSRGAVEPEYLLKDSAGTLPSSAFTERMMYLDMMTYLPDDVLVKVDRATMAASLESRAPFLDHRVIEFAARVPQRYKIRRGTTKWLLRQVLYRHVPRAVVDRPKMGFGVPIEHWLRAELRDWAEDLLSVDRLKSDGFFDPTPIRAKWDEHQSGRRNWQHVLWNILMFQAWLRAQ